MTLVKRTPIFWLITLLLTSLHPPSSAQDDDSPAFTRAQAGAGRTLYRKVCAACHGAKLEGLDIAPALTGRRFDSTWRGKSADTLSFHIRRMPPEDASNKVTLSDEDSANLLAYILISNDFAAGDAALPSDPDALAKVDIPLLEGMDIDPYVPVELTKAQAKLLNKLPSVTDKMLRDPSPKDWLHWGRTYDGHSYSPLKKINKSNIKDLKPAWRAPLVFGSSMPMPLVNKGVMFLHTYPDTVIAMDATNGDVLWRYAREGLRQSNKKMGMALHDDRIYVSTTDHHMIALSAKTGELVWDHPLNLGGNEAWKSAIQMRSAPLIAGDVVIQGTIGFRVPKGAFITALNRETGEEAWRFQTVAWPDKPGGNTWNDLPVEKRNGGSVWQQGTYDPDTNLVYFGIAPTYDTAPLLEATQKEGHNNNAMYTNCTVALDADTGELVWYYQHVQNDQWDMDWAFERQLIDIPDGKGGTQRAVMNVGKNVMLDALNAKTGQFLFSLDSGLQNVITHVDPVTGYKTIDPSKMPNPETGSIVAPVPWGARSWPQTSYSPLTNYVYVPISESAMEIGTTNSGGRLLSTGINIDIAHLEALDDGMMGRLQALDVANRKLAWNTDVERPLSTGVLSTAGGVVFAGDIDPSLKAFDHATGELLWQVPLDDSPTSSIITYKVGDTQYVALVVGMTNNHVRDVTRGYRWWTKTQGAPGDLGGGAVWVFSL